MAPFMDALTDTSEVNGQSSWADSSMGAAEPIAICGMALRLPGGIATPEQFWDFLINKKDARGPVPESRFNAFSYYSESGKPGHMKTQYGYFLDESVDLAALDTTFFRMPKTEVERADPQQRLLLELTRECLESAGETNYRGKTVGTFVGCFGEDWLETLTKDTEVVGQYKITGYGDFMLSNRLSYEYDLKGPSMTIRTGCSSALIGLHEACMSINNGQCNAAIVAGSNLIMAPGLFVSMSEQGVLSPNGSCRTFDAGADGYARGEAVNVVYVKRLSDAIRDGNPIRAVIRGTSSNADGKTPSLTIPSFESHEAMIRRAYAMATIDDSDIPNTGFVECHGTGTAAGDPIETTAISKVFGTSGIYIGSCKPNIGHSEGASGITSLIKSIMALEKRTIPPNIKFDTPNPKIPFDRNGLKVPVVPTPWPEDRIERVSVNSFGIGGANAHVVIESAASFLGLTSLPPNIETTTIPRRQAHLMVFSANTADSLRRQVVNNQKYISQHDDSLDDIAYTLSSRRIHLSHRAFSVLKNGAEKFTSPFSKTSPSSTDLVLVFTGQGAQWPRMGVELLQSNKTFTQSMRQMDKVLSALPDSPSWTLVDELLKPTEISNLHKAYLSQPVCTAVQVALVDTLYEAAGIQAFAVVGHSSGEMAAAYAAGRLTANEAIIAAYYRGIASSEVTKVGAMAAVGMGRAKTAPFLIPGVVIACENSPSSVTISGDAERVENVLSEIRAAHPEVLARLLKVEKAYHSHHMQEVGERYLSLTSPYMSNHIKAEDSEPLFFSSVTGMRLPEDEATDANYWRSNLESPVLFDAAVTSLVSEHQSKSSGKLMFLEIGPHSAMAGPLRQILTKVSLELLYATCLVRSMDSTESLLTALGQLWQQGVSVDFNRLTNPNGNARVVTDLPTYPWQHDHSLLFSSRISDEWRFRKYPKHELLGVRIPESSHSEPVFRNVFTLNYVPWVRDHNIKGDVIFPCAGYVGMAGEAARQLHHGTFAGFAMRNVVIDMAMVLADSKSTEIITSLKKERLTDSLDGSWWEFTITSHNGSSWLKHCSGQVKALEEADGRTRGPPTKLSRVIGPGKWYQALRNVGANYGPYFQGLHHVTCSPTNHRSHGTAMHTVKDETFYPVHPTKIDFFLQLFSVAAVNGVGHGLDKMNVPTFIESLEIFNTDSEIDMEVSASQTPRGLICGGGHGVTSDGGLALSLKGVKLSPLENDASEEDPDPHAGARIFWQPDVDFLRISDLIEAHPNQGNLARTQQLALNYIEGALSRLGDVQTTIPHLARFRSWMKKQPPPQTSIDMEVFKPTVSEFGPFGSFVVAMQKVFDNIVAIFRGETEPLEILMPDNVLTNVYNSLNITNRVPLFQALGHSKPNLRVLEIGAGTGGTTNKVLEWLRGPTGALLYSEYTYTDISAGFFSAAQERFKEYPNMTFKSLDVSKDPVDQGFEPASYDLILAANVLHATPSLRETLMNVRKLLQPEGRLYMEELSHDALPMNFVMSVLPGWWLGADDGRPDQPHVSSDRWDMELRDAGFDGLENVAFDSERPNNLLAFMTARPAAALTPQTAVGILHASCSAVIAADLKRELARLNLEGNLHDIADGLPVNCHEIIATLDMEAPFFENISAPALSSFQDLIAAASKSHTGIFWLTRSSQLRCSDPRWAQTIGTTRSIRSELSLDLATCEVDGVSSLSTIAKVFAKFQRHRNNSKYQPEYEYSIHNDVVQIPRVYPINVSEELQRMSQKKGGKGDKGDKGDKDDEGPDKPDINDCSDCDLLIAKYGRLGTLSWVPRYKRELVDDEVIIDAKAAGMNFKDVLIAMGIVDSANSRMGLEAAGVVREIGPNVRTLAPGDRVFVFGGGCFSTGITISEKLCVKIPDSLSFEDAATMPCVFSTVIHGLLEIGHLESGDSVLIHSACGGVGLAAMQICKMAGAEIFCTVGSEEKAKYLMSTFGMPRDHIFQSRDASFLPDILDATGGRGVDIVLNSLSGELLHASWSCVAEFGKMIEIGKRDFIGNGKLALNPFEMNRSYHGVDLGHLIELKPEKGNRLLKKIVELYETGHVTALRPIKTFDADGAEECFRYMQKGQHIGKIVLKMDGLSAIQTAGCSPSFESSFDGNSAYFIVGGLGGLGRLVSNWMVKHGARNFVYLSRQGGDTEDNQNFIKELEDQGCMVSAVKGSVTSLADIEKAFATSQKPIRGVINMSMILRDQGFTKMTHEEWTTAVDPKVLGTWNLHNACVSSGLELDFFLLFSSISGIVGQKGQANYAGANTFLDAFVQYRHNLGMAAASIDVGAMMDYGYLAENPVMMEKLTAQGMYGVKIPQLLDAVSVLVNQPIPQLSSVPTRTFFDPSQLILGHRSLTSLLDSSNRVIWKEDRRMAVYYNSDGTTRVTEVDTVNSTALQKFLTSTLTDFQLLSTPEAPVFLARQIGGQLFRLLLKPAENDAEIDVNMSLQDAGLDSLVAVEMRSWWKGVFEFDISVLEMLGMGSLLALGERAAKGLREGQIGSNQETESGEKHSTEDYLRLKMP